MLVPGEDSPGFSRSQKPKQTMSQVSARPRLLRSRRGLRTIARDAATRTMQRKRRGSIRALNYANPTDVYSPFGNTEAERQRR
jgi:hypothetical protein